MVHTNRNEFGVKKLEAQVVSDLFMKRLTYTLLIFSLEKGYS